MKKCAWFFALILGVVVSASADPSVNPSARAPEGYSGGWTGRSSCQVDCPTGGIPEGEPNCYDGYRDSTNTGCNCNEFSPPTVCTFAPISCGDTICGTAGTYLYTRPSGEVVNFRDTDWYKVVLTEPATISWSVVAEFPVQLYILIPEFLYCYNIWTDWEASGDPCQIVTATSDCLPAGEYYLWIGPQDFVGVPCVSDYVAWVQCSPCCLGTELVAFDAGLVPQCECVHLCPGISTALQICPITADPGPPPIVVITPGCFPSDLPNGYCNEECDPIPTSAFSFSNANWVWDDVLYCWVNQVISYAEGCACLCLEGFLAVELQSFTADAGDGSVILNWQTASERENDHFEVWRDGRVAAGNIRATNNPSGAHYTWTDRDLQNGRTYRYELVAVDLNGNRTTLASTEATPVTSSAQVISGYALHQNYPNPFNPRTSIRFDLVQSGFVKLTVHNTMGQQVATVVSGEMAGGSHTVTFDGSHLPSGMYLYRLEVNGFRATQKMLLMK